MVYERKSSKRTGGEDRLVNEGKSRKRACCMDRLKNEEKRRKRTCGVGKLMNERNSGKCMWGMSSKSRRSMCFDSPVVYERESSKRTGGEDRLVK